MSINHYILVVTDYATKWVVAWMFHTNIIITTKFLYKHILTRFGCLLTIMTDQGTHIINDAIRFFIDHFIFRHTNFIVYYPQGNGQGESTNKVFGTLLVDSSQSILFSYFHFYWKLEHVIPHFSLCMDYIHYSLQNTCYHPNLVKTKIHNLLKS